LGIFTDTSINDVYVCTIHKLASEVIDVKPGVSYHTLPRLSLHHQWTPEPYQYWR